MKLNKGFTLVEAAVALAALSLYLIISLNGLLGIMTLAKAESEMKEFLGSSFVALKLRHQEFLITNSYCFTVTPPDYTFADLSSSYSILDADKAPVWLDLNSMVYRVTMNPVTGRVEGYQITVIDQHANDTVPAFMIDPYFTGQEELAGSTKYTYSQDFKLNTHYRALYSTTDSSCVRS